MATNLALDDKLIMEVLKIGHFRTKKEAVTKAMMEFVSRHKQQEILSLMGKIDYEIGYDPKADRE